MKKVFKKLLSKLIRFLTYILDGEIVEEIFYCDYVILEVITSAKENKIIVDLSAYEKYGIGRFVLHTPAQRLFAEEENEELLQQPLMVEDCAIIKMKSKKGDYWTLSSSVIEI